MYGSKFSHPQNYAHGEIGNVLMDYMLDKNHVWVCDDLFAYVMMCYEF